MSLKHSTMEIRHKATAPQGQTWLEVWGKIVSRQLGSLQVAVVLLTLFAIVLAVGTVAESWYSAAIAQELVYQSWWFVVLLLLLGVNIFFAAAKKWPWKKHQTGFLITHLGLITMIIGGILNSFGGTDALMSLLDTSDPVVLTKNGMVQESNEIILPDDAMIRVRRGTGEWKTYDFSPGSFAWKGDRFLQPNHDPLMTTLQLMSNPLPKSWQVSLGEDARLEVLNYYPHARREPYSPSETGTMAFKIKMESERAGAMPAQWIAYDTQDIDKLFERSTMDLMGIGRVELLGYCADRMLQEFLRPPALGEMGPKGVLAIIVDGVFHRFDVAQNLGKTLTVGRGQSQLRFHSTSDAGGTEFDLIHKGKTQSYRVISRFPGFLLPRPSDEIHVWFHTPDPRLQRQSLRGLLQVIQNQADGKLYYRSYSSKVGGFRFENSGPAETGKPTDVWGGMLWNFTIEEFLPRAERKRRYVPEDMPPGMKHLAYEAAVRCRLTVGKDQVEFWRGVDTRRNPPISVGDQRFDISYEMKREKLPFSIKLLRVEQAVDPGTNRAAMYTSWVQLTDKAKDISGAEHIVTMNEPLEHRGYSIFQTNFNNLPSETLSKPVGLSGFTVAHDPGLWLKYIGSTMLALGIATMFYMKAYFFKPRKRVSNNAVRSNPL